MQCEAAGPTRFHKVHAEQQLGRKEGSPLTFMLNGEDLTTLEQSMTQALIDQHLAAPLLPRTVFHLRGDSGNLLEVGSAAMDHLMWHSKCRHIA